MSEPTAPVPSSASSAPSSSGPPSQPPEGGERRRLDRPPGDRYAPGAAAQADGAPEPAPSSGGIHAKPVIGAILVADAGALLFFGLSQVNLGLGLLAVAAFLGWVTALALVWRGREAAIGDGRLRAAMAAFLGGWAVAGGLLLDWVYALVQGGTLGLLDYVGERYGPVALLCVAIAAAVAVARAR